MLLFTDGFDSYAATADLFKKWSAIGADWAWNSTAGRTGGGAVVGGTTGGTGLTSRSILGSVTPIGIGFWMKCSSPPAALANFLSIFNSGASNVGNLAMNTSGQIHFRGNAGATQGGTSVNIADDAWHWIEAQFNLGSAAATMKLYVDTVVVTNGSFAVNNTGQTGNALLFQFLSIAGETLTIDDVIVYNNTGTIVLADLPLGPREITTLRPSADDATQFTRSTGANSSALVDEVNGDVSDYVEDNVPGHQDTYDYGNLGFTPAAINAVVVNSYLHNPNAGTINHKQVAKSGGTTTEGSSVITPSAPVVLQEPFYVDPNTAAAWAGSAVDAAKFGIKVS
jgi:hypothetical protein